jgi:uncharacterized glyoxalase superfamily protein PhnB
LHVIHAEIKIDDSVVMLSDGFPQGKCRSQETIGGTAVMIHVYNEDENLEAGTVYEFIRNVSLSNS